MFIFNTINTNLDKSSMNESVTIGQWMALLMVNNHKVNNLTDSLIDHQMVKR